MDIKIRKAANADTGLLNSMAAVVFPVTYKEILSPEQLNYMFEWMYSVPSIQKQMEDGHHYFIAYRENIVNATVEDLYLGYASVEQEKNDLFHLQKIYVMPGYQGKQIGKLLFKEVVDFIRTIHPEECVLELNVNRKNKAVGFYKSMGMEISRSGDFPIGNGYYMNDYIMSLKIDNDIVI